MKKIRLFLIASVVCLLLCACTQNVSNNNNYDALIGYIEAGNYAGAFTELNKFFNSENLQLEAVIPGGNIILNGENTNDDSEETTKPTETVDITAENFLEYFELDTEDQWQHDAFGVANFIQRVTRYVLKEEYSKRLVQDDLKINFDHDVALEVSFTKVPVSIKVDYNNKSYTFSDTDEEEPEQITKQQKVYTHDLLNGAAEELYMVGWSRGKDSAAIEDYIYYLVEDVSILRAQGTLVFYTEE